MFTVVILVILAACWLVANGKYDSTKMWRYRRMRSAFSWAFVGACVGSYFGVAGMGSAIAGTIPGAIVGYLAASNLMKRDADPTEGER